MSAGQLAGLISRRARDVTATTYEAAWQRDQAYINAIDEALHDVIDGREADDAPAPAWLDGLARRELRTAARTSWSRDTFARTRLLERVGLVTPEHDDVYVLAMVSSLGADKAARLRSDPELLETVLWRVFEVEGGGEVSLTNIDRFGGSQWREAFLELTSDGTLDRARVLAACVGALGRDFAAYRASWYAATFLALEPSGEESAQLQSGLRRLLSADVPATVAFALRQLGRVQRAGLLDARDTLAALPPATTVKAKGTALEALRLARTAGGDVPAVVRVATAGLGHRHPDVQRAAGELLGELGHRASIESAGDELAPSVRQDLGIVGRSPARPPHAPADQVLAEVPAPVTARELAERTAALLEDSSDALELEAVLAALAEPGTELRLRPLSTRARAVLARGSATNDGDDWLPGQVARLVLTLLDEPVRPTTVETTAARFVARRLQELRAQTSPLLATPDLPGGWVSPAALVERLARTPRPRHHDMIAALLRLHPDGRELHGIDGLPPAVVHAFRGVEPTRRRVGRSPSGPESWWVAARRSRGAYAPAETPQVDGEMRTHRWQEGGRERGFTYVEFTVTTPGTGDVPDDHPVEQPVGSAAGYGLGDWIPTLASVWPHDAEHFLALTAAGMLSATGSTEVAPDVPRVLDALARHPGRLGLLAVHVVAAGLSAAQREHRLHAVDAFLDLVPTGRLAAGDIADTLARYADAWPAVRWAESLTAVSQGPGGSAAAVDLLTALLPQLPANHRGLHGLLGVLRDESLRCARPVADPRLRQWLGLLTGSSAAASTARQLLR
ncbi:DUF6493 family protein [Cellulomonas soli]|uniref:DUF6493 family protein n=1 Tax=Cellulomonas soli TaxID=931535 RepID=UPI003F857078